MEQVKAVIFDMDGLMFDTEIMYYQANKEVADRIGLDFTYDYYAQYIGMSDEELHRNLYLDYEDEAKVTQLIKESSDMLFDIIKPSLNSFLQEDKPVMEEETEEELSLQYRY